MAKKRVEYEPIRLSHLLSQSGPGAVVRGRDSLFVVQDTRFWTNKEGETGTKIIPYVERARYALGIQKELREPPTAKMKDEEKKIVEGVCIPVNRFPSWMKCPKCGKLYPWEEWKKLGARPTCTCGKGKTRLEQVMHCMVHENGYLADVPWKLIAHSNKKNNEKQRACKHGEELYLDIEKRELRCGVCEAKSEFRERREWDYGSKTNIQPWLWKTPAPEEFRKDLKARIRKVNDLPVYSPVAVSALVIPPESRVRKGTVVDRLYRNSDARARLENLKNAKTELDKKSRLNLLSDEFNCTVQEIEDAYEDILKGYPNYGMTFSDTQIEESEYSAFFEKLDDLQDDEDFVFYNITSNWKKHLKSNPGNSKASTVDALIRVDRLKEIRVFKGFQREGGDIVPPDIDGSLSWIPAIEMYGEGLFIRLNESKLVKWEENSMVKKRVLPLVQRYEKSGRVNPDIPNARFILLHTLSHLIIRQLETGGGYPAASLNERIYYSKPGGSNPMSGILIYTTSPDKSGTLGGLAELTRPRQFWGVFTRALDHSAWCSADPVCREHKGQGPDLLNLAACHACVLIPDTACAYGNLLLDRLLVKGGDDLPGFLEEK